MREQLADIDEEILLADGLDEALIGYVALYDRAKCIQIFVNEGMTEEEAEEYFEFNTAGAYVGEYTPAFATLLTDDDE